MTDSQHAKALALQALHAGPRTFLIGNAWDGASARILEGMGYAALATSSGAAAATLGRRDGRISRDEAMEHCRILVSVTALPVSADLENGFFASPDEVAHTIRLAAEAGLVGGSIEDASGNVDQPIYDFNYSVERVAAAVEAARTLPFPFSLTARTENYLHGRPDLDDTIARLQAFERAGADVLFAPGIPDIASVRAICSAVKKPVNFMAGIRGKSFSMAELSEAGVRRVSMATSLYRAAMTGLMVAAQEASASGTFNYIDRSVTTSEISAYLGG